MATSAETFSDNSLQTGTSQERGLRPTGGSQRLTEEDKGYMATCEESYNITRQMLALHALYPNSLYAI